MRDVSYNAAAKGTLASVKLELSMVSGLAAAAARKGYMVMWRSTCMQRVSKKVGQVEDAGDEHEAKLALIHEVTEPIETHVQGLSVLWRHGVVGEPDRALVIAVDNGGRLGVAEIGQYLALIQGNAGGGKDTSDFGLGDK
jgi:hypothetical protein